MASPGLLLDGRYRLEARVAAGGMGEVWRGTDLALGRKVAVKLLLPEYAWDAESAARFRAEARLAGRVSHPNIAQVFDYCDRGGPGGDSGGSSADGGRPYLVMELVDGPSLTTLLADGPTGIAYALGITAQVAAGLAAAHAADLVHRDIKPANLLISKDGLVKITDFGVAHGAGAAPVTQTGEVVGTAAYLAPERGSGAPAKPQADLYSLGIVAYECLTGQRPFSGEPLAVVLAHKEQPLPELPPEVPPEVVALVAELTAKDPDARPPSAAQVAARAEQLRAELTGTAPTRRRLPVLAGAMLNTGPPAAQRAAAAAAARVENAGAQHGKASRLVGLAVAGDDDGGGAAAGAGPSRHWDLFSRPGPRTRAGLLTAAALVLAGATGWTFVSMNGHVSHARTSAGAPPAARVTPHAAPVPTRATGIGTAPAVPMVQPSTPAPWLSDSPTSASINTQTVTQPPAPAPTRSSSPRPAPSSPSPSSASPSPSSPSPSPSRPSPPPTSSSPPPAPSSPPVPPGPASPGAPAPSTGNPAPTSTSGGG